MRILLILLAATQFSMLGFSQKKAPAKKVGVVYTETKAQECLDDYYSFYNNDYTYRNAKVRRISNNTFYISLQEGDKKFVTPKVIELPDFNGGTKKGVWKDDESNEFFWHSKVYVLTILSSTKYKIHEKGF